MFCLETRHVHAALQAQRNKTDVNDARDIAQLVRSGWFKAVHVKSDQSYWLRLLLGHRRTLKRKFLDLENTIRHSIKVFVLRIGAVGRAGFEAKVRELMASDLLACRHDGSHAAGARGALGRVQATAQGRRADRCPGCGLPARHGRPRGRTGDGALLPHCHRRPRTLRPLA
jgi:transposase